MREEKLQQYTNGEGDQRNIKELKNIKEDVLMIMSKLPVLFRGLLRNRLTDEGESNF